MTDAPSQSQDKFIVRLPDGMRQRIKAAADRNQRSMNAELVSTLQRAYPDPDYAISYFIGMFTAMDRAAAEAVLGQVETGDLGAQLRERFDSLYGPR